MTPKSLAALLGDISKDGTVLFQPLRNQSVRKMSVAQIQNRLPRANRHSLVEKTRGCLCFL